jgi:hypothetical protein
LIEDIDIALQKLNSEIEKDINRIIDMSQECSWFETQYFIYNLHLARILNAYPDLSNHSNKSFIQTLCSTHEDTFKYAIQLLIKYGNRSPRLDINYMPILNEELVLSISKNISLLNNKYELKGLIQLVGGKTFGENNRYLEVDYSMMRKNPLAEKFFNYFLRLEIDNNIKHRNLLFPSQYLNQLRSEYRPHKDLFEEEFGITLEKFLVFIEYVVNTSEMSLKELESKLPVFQNGNVHVLSPMAFMMYVPHITMDKNDLKNKYGKDIYHLLGRLTYDPNELNEFELKYHLLTRKPLIASKQTDKLIISPELLLDSLAINIHYSMLEGSVHNKYKQRYSDEFINLLVDIAKPSGYVEVGRERNLYNGVKQIGDVDLILKNKDDHFLLIEAKNHTLPLNVYFKDLTAVKNRLSQLQEQWEKKVKNRISHLRTNHSKYSIGPNFTYLIVSKQPEVLSHFTDLLCLSQYEFQKWIKAGDFTTEFTDLYEKLYGNIDGLTKEDIDVINREGITVMIKSP